jgi:hypothetical protein
VLLATVVVVEEATIVVDVDVVVVVVDVVDVGVVGAVNVAVAELTGTARRRCWFVGTTASTSHVPLPENVAIVRAPNTSMVLSPNEHTEGVRLMNRTSLVASVNSFLVPSGMLTVAQNDTVSPVNEDHEYAERNEVFDLLPLTRNCTRVRSFVTSKLTLVETASCVSVAAIEAVIVHVPAELR